MGGAVGLTLLSFSLFLYLFFPKSGVNASGFVFDVEELRRISYIIGISDLPRLIEDIKLANIGAEEDRIEGVTLSNKFGQPYHCTYDLTSQLDALHRDVYEIVADDSNQLLALKESSSSAACLTRTYHWWTYEFCYGRNITQYHMENGKLSGDVIMLGTYESDFDWNAPNVNETDEFLRRYHSQHYVNGTACEPTGGNRSVLVMFTCDNDENSPGIDAIYDVSELTTCQYVVNMHVAKLCNLRRLRSVVNRRKPVVIDCRPVLSKRHSRLTRRRENTIVSEATTTDSVVNNLKKQHTELAEYFTASNIRAEKLFSNHLFPESLSLNQLREKYDVENYRDSGDITNDPTSEEEGTENPFSLHSSDDSSQPVNDESSEYNLNQNDANPETRGIEDVPVLAVNANGRMSVQNERSASRVRNNDVAAVVNEKISQMEATTLQVGGDAPSNPSVTDISSPKEEKDKSKVNQGFSSLDKVPLTKMKFFVQPDSPQDYPYSTRYNDDKDIESSNDLPKESVNSKLNQEITEIEVVHVAKTDNTEQGSAEVGESYMKWTGPGGKVYRISTNELTATVTVYTPFHDENEEHGPDKEYAGEVGLTALERVRKQMSEKPTRKTEVKIINTEYYDEDGKPVAAKRPNGFKKEVMAVFQKNDDEVMEFRNHRTLEKRYNGKWAEKNENEEDEKKNTLVKIK